ncbi:putative cop9 signalosome complex subunit 1 [Papiliotrema laurentii]|uniref:Cop9 signalosome complex subunit 1 n=1 Tax=Papiliotrema laurentii TaxID=5418 RepID=A0AAD9CXP5_PAPLA|nr:putative cop9 signalosome complex subunit 1 [Papiliotrema laurentii]
MAREMTPPEAGPSSPSSTTQAVPGFTEQEAYLYRVFETFDAGTFDWNAYQGTYKGRALIVRLMHIATLVRLPLPANAPPPPPPLLQLMRSALERVTALLKESTWDVQTYTQAITLLDAIDSIERRSQAGMDVDTPSGGAGTGSGADMDWVETARENEKKESAKLDVELRGYMSNLIKESIRLTYLAFGELSLKAGSSSAAMKNFSAAREYSTSGQHHLDLQTAIIDTCLSYNLISSISGHITKLEAALNRLYPAPGSDKQPGGGPGKSTQDMASMTASDVRDSRERQAKGSAVRQKVGVQIRVARGLLALSNRRFEEAGRNFAEIGEEGGLNDWEGVAISTSDVALITALCVLSTGDRSRIRRVLLERTSFRTSLEDSQTWVLDLINAFIAAEYSKASQTLQRAEPFLLLNPYLAPHISEFRLLLDSRSIVQYVEPFLTVKIATMASSFGVPESSMLDQIVDLIHKGKIKGKVDLIDRVLVLKEADPRSKVIAHALAVGKETTAASHAALVRMRMHEAGIAVDPKPIKADELAAQSDPLVQGTVQGGGEMQQPSAVEA